MSASTPDPTPPRDGRPPAPRAGPREFRFLGLPIWWLMSAAFHTVVLGWLVLFSPVRIIDLDRVRAQFTAGTEKIRRVMEDVLDRQAVKEAEHVRALQELRREMEELQAQKEEQLRRFSTEFAHDAPAQAEEAQQAALQAQADALAAQAEARAEIDKTRQAATPESLEPVAARQQQSLDAQGRAAPAMERALQTLAMSDPAFEPARQAQAAANDAQRQAEQAQTAASQARDDTREVQHQVPARQADAERAAEAVQRTQAALDKARTDAETATRELEAAKNEAVQAQNAAAEAAAATERQKAEVAKARDEAAKLDAKDPARKAAKEAVSQAQKQANEAAAQASAAATRVRNAGMKAEALDKKAARNEEKVHSDIEHVAKSEATVAAAKTEAEQARARAAAAAAKLAEQQDAARRLQEQARQAQERARAALAAARRDLKPSGAPELAAAPAAPAPAARAPDLSGMDLANLYQTAVQTEVELTQSYKQLRAAELAMVRQIPLARALELTEVAKVVRPDLQAALRAKVNGGEDATAVRDAAEAAGSEIRAMETLGNSLLMLAKGIDAGSSGSAGGATLTLEQIKAKSGHEGEMAQLAAEDGNARAKDLSGAMQAGAGGTGAAAAAAGGGGAPAPGGKAGGVGENLPPGVPKQLKAMPGRKVRRGAPSTGWLYVDSWYLLGPFDNPGRRNIEKQFPPETVVDLSATYTGKDGQPIRWEFHQSPNPCVNPPFDHYKPQLRRPQEGDDYSSRGLEYIIYYAYTELYFEEACDLWIAVGSDDYSKLWIEDQLVWASGKEHKPWIVDEGLRKVHFRQGVNRVLFRVENGWHVTGFSLVLVVK